MTDEALAGLARNPALPADLRDLLVHHPDAPLWELAGRADLTPAQLRTLVARGGSPVAARLARHGRLPTAPTEPVDTSVVLALLDGGADRPDLARRLARHPDRGGGGGGAVEEGMRRPGAWGPP
ncbi:hypothetical protein ACFT9M_25275, partial [Micromonospora purpureochromogenes]